MEWTKQKLEEVCVELQKKAMVDEAFRKELLADSAKAIEMLTGERPPEGFRLKVIENDPACTATMVLPDLVGRELTDEEFEAVSGGLSFSGLLPKTKLFSRDMAMASSPLVSGKAKDKADCFLNMPINEAK